jgi:hypothetical protein
MATRDFDVTETRHFLTLTERASNRSFRIPISDALLVGGLAGPTWRGGDVVKLSDEQQKSLADLDARCRSTGDDAAIQHNKLSNKLGCLSWIILFAVIALIVWWIIGSHQ